MNMQLSQEAIEQFRKKYCEEFGEEISPDEASEKLLRLVNFMRVIFQSRPNKGGG